MYFDPKWLLYDFTSGIGAFMPSNSEVVKFSLRFDYIESIKKFQKGPTISVSEKWGFK